MRVLVLAVFSAFLGLAPSVATAQESQTSLAMGQEPGAAWETRVGVELASARFHLADGSGQYMSTTAIADATLREWWGVRLTVPVDTLALDGAAPRVGIGDVQLRTKIRFFDRDPWRVQASVTAQFPTGDIHNGMGNGAPSLNVLVTAGYAVRRAILFLTVSDSFSIRRYGTAPDNFIDPSSDHEIVATAGALVRIRHGLAAQLTVTPIFPLLAADRGSAFFYATPLLQWSHRFVRLGASVQVPIAGVFRFDVRTVFNALLTLP